LLFLVAASHKLRDPGRFRTTLAEYRLLPGAVVPLAAMVVIGIEIVVAIALLAPARRAPGPVAAAAVLVVYGAAIAVNLARGRRHIDCGCAGPAVRRPISGWLVARNAALAAAALTSVAPVRPRPLVWVDVLTVLGATGTLAGAVRDIGASSPDRRATLLFVLSPTCPVCKALLPALRSVVRSEGHWLDLVLASDGTREEHEPFVREQQLDPSAYVLSPALGITYRVEKLPYAVLLDAAGIVRSKGLVNTREHLESLFEARERGVSSIQDFLGRAQQDMGVGPQ